MSHGWDNELFRLGDEWVVRMPRRAAAVPLLLNEQRWLPSLQKLVDPPLPVPVAVGLPSTDFVWPWSITRLLPGVPAAYAPISSRDALVEPLADFVRSLHVPAAWDAPDNPVRGTPLATRDDLTRARLATADIPHVSALLATWERGLAVPVYNGPALWMHGDLHPLNVLLTPSGSLAAVLDFGDLGRGDPACDLSAAWMFFDPEQRARFRERIGAGVHDDAAWTRAAGWATAFAAAILQDTALTPIAEHTIEQLVAER